jgi:putative membrane protein
MTAAAVAAALAAGLLVLVRRAGAWPRARTASGLGGLAALALAGLLDARADAQLSVHVAQHGALVLVAAPLLVAAAPVRLALAVLPHRGRRTLGRALHRPVVRTLAHPAVGLLAFAAVTALAVAPAVEDAALRHPLLHALQHAALLWSAILLWLGAIAVDPLPRRAGPIGRVALVLAGMVVMAVAGAVVATADHPLYAAYPDLADQRTAGGIMWMAGMVASLPALLACAWSALHAEERRQRARDLHGAGA